MKAYSESLISMLVYEKDLKSMDLTVTSNSISQMQLNTFLYKENMMEQGYMASARAIDWKQTYKVLWASCHIVLEDF